MAVSKAQKVEILNDLIAKFKEAKSLGFASTNTLTVEEFGNLRKDLREVWATYSLAKKTLIKKALKEALDLDVDLAILEGQIGVVCSNDDPVAGLSKINDLVKKTKWEKVAWAASIFEGELKDLEETKTIASMPSRDTLLGRLVGSMKSPISSLARFFDAAAKELEEKAKAKLSELDKAEEKKEEVKTEEVKTEEKVEEAKTETPAIEEKAEEKKEEEK